MATDITTTLHDLFGDEGGTLFAMFEAEHPDRTAQDFVAHMHSQGALTDEELLAAYARVDTHLQLPNPPAQHQDLFPEEQPYRRLSSLGEGAMGEVYIAVDDALKRTVAVKRMHPQFAQHASGVRRFYNEALISAQLDHPAIIPVYCLFRNASGHLEYAMKVVRGQTFSDLIYQVRVDWHDGDEPPEERGLPARLELFLQVCNAMHYAHSRGVLHRDLKPDNVMLGAFHEVVVMDWGIAKVQDSSDLLSELPRGGGSAAATQVGTVVGTPVYMSPEQASAHELDARSDQYALGLILHELIGLKRANPGTGTADSLAIAKSGELLPLVAPHAKQPVPRELRAIVNKATAHRTDDRYDSVQDLGDDVRRYLRGEPVHAAPDTPWQSLARWLGAHREAALGSGMVLGFMAVLAVIAVIGGAYVVRQQDQARATAREQELIHLVGVTTERSFAIDTRFLRVEALIERLGLASELALQQPADDTLVYTSADFEREPPESMLSIPGHPEPVDLDHQVFKLAPGVSDVDERMRQLATLRPAQYDLLVRSLGESALKLDADGKRDLLTTVQAPIVWAFVAVEEGVHAKLPGKGGYHDDYDPRSREWYRNAAKSYGPVWSGAYIDADGSRLLIPCSVSVRDAGNELLGVAAVDLSVTHVAHELLDPKLGPDVQALIVDTRGEVVVQASDRSVKDLAATDRTFPWAKQLASARQQTHAGHFTVQQSGERHLVLWGDLTVMDWTYVIVGSEAALLGE